MVDVSPKVEIPWKLYVAVPTAPVLFFQLYYW